MVKKNKQINNKHMYQSHKKIRGYKNFKMKDKKTGKAIHKKIFIGTHTLQRKEVVFYFKRLHPLTNPDTSAKLKKIIPKDLKVCERCGRWLNYIFKDKDFTKKEYHNIEKLNGELPKFFRKEEKLLFCICKSCMRDKMKKKENSIDIEDIGRFKISLKEIGFTK